MKLLLIPVIPKSVKVSNQSNRLFSISGYPVKKAGKGFMVDSFYSRLFWVCLLSLLISWDLVC